MGADYLVEAGESGGGRIHLKQNKEIEVYEYIVREQWPDRREVVCNEAVGLFLKGEMRGYSDIQNSASFGNCAWL